MKKDWGLVLHSAWFVLGFTLVFAVLGVLIEHFFASASLALKQYFSWLGGGMIIVFGLLLTGLVRVPWLEREHRLQASSLGNSHATSFAFGAAFGFGWSPCVGAILGAIITLATTNPVSAMALMIAYSLGLGVPFLIAGYFAEHAKQWIQKLGSKLRTIQIIFGLLLVALGALIFTNGLVKIAELTAASQLFISIDAGLASTGIGMGVAFIAGLASFLSPCVFPLLPVYLSYLGGLALQNNK